MKETLHRILTRIKELSTSDKTSIVSAIIAGLSLIISGISFGWSIYSNNGQDLQWKASFEEQQVLVATLQDDNKTLKMSLAALTDQNAITKNQTIIRSIRDIKDSAAITEYVTVIGYG